MIEKIEQESVALEGVVETPNQNERLFKNLDALLDFCKMSKPDAFNVRNGRNEKGQIVWQLVYPRSNY